MSKENILLSGIGVRSDHEKIKLKKLFICETRFRDRKVYLKKYFTVIVLYK